MGVWECGRVRECVRERGQRGRRPVSRTARPAPAGLKVTFTSSLLHVKGIFRAREEQLYYTYGIFTTRASSLLHANVIFRAEEALWRPPGSARKKAGFANGEASTCRFDHQFDH